MINTHAECQVDFRGQNWGRFPPTAVSMLEQSPKPSDMCLLMFWQRESLKCFFFFFCECSSVHTKICVFWLHFINYFRSLKHVFSSSQLTLFKSTSDVFLTDFLCFIRVIHLELGKLWAKCKVCIPQGEALCDDFFSSHLEYQWSYLLYQEKVKHQEVDKLDYMRALTGKQGAYGKYINNEDEYACLLRSHLALPYNGLH